MTYPSLPRLDEYAELAMRGRPQNPGFHLAAPVECITAEGWRVTMTFKAPDGTLPPTTPVSRYNRPGRIP